ncbi:MAG: hypothetical protein RL095_1776 [Verrucomicrobiota bacterium]
MSWLVISLFLLTPVITCFLLIKLINFLGRILLAETLSDVNQKKLRHVFIFCALVKEKLSDPEINQDMDRIEKEFKEQGVNNELVAEMYFELINPGFRS